MRSSISNTLSQAIAWMRFPLIIMIVLLHCYCAIDAHGHPFFFKLIYPVGLWLGETGVPAFFFISGLLFFYSQKSYVSKLKTRVKTLLVPYLLWNSLVLIAYWILSYTNYSMLIAGKSIADYRVLDYVRAFIDRGDWDYGNGVPLLCPYWYIRNLMVLCILSPLIYYIIKYLKLLWILLLFIWWISIPYNGMIASSLLFFCMGGYFPIIAKDPLQGLIPYRYYFLCFCFLLFIIDWSGHMTSLVPYGLYLHRMSLISNIFALLLIGSMIGTHNSPYQQILNKAAFWIFTVHYPMTLVVDAIYNRYLVQSSDLLLIAYYGLSFIVVIIACLVSFMMMNKYFPSVLSFLTGSRS